MRLETLDGQSIACSEALDALGRYGLLRIAQCAVDELQAFLDTWTEPYSHPHEDAPGVTLIRPMSTRAAEAGMAAFTHSKLKLHTDRASSPAPPAVLSTLVIEQSSSGGDAIFLDGDTLFPSTIPDENTLGGLTLCADERNGNLPLLEVKDDGRRFVRYRDDEIGHPEARNPEAGDLLERIYGCLSQPVHLHMGPGQGYILHNCRYLHGREAFSGHRVVVRFLGNVRVRSSFALLNQGFKPGCAGQ